MRDAKVGFVRDPEHHKLGGHTGPWTEKRPKAEMLQDFEGFTEDCLDMLSVCGLTDPLHEF